LIVVSNRIAGAGGKSAAAGGLAVALRQALTGRDGVWLGWSGAVSDEPSDEPVMKVVEGVTHATLDLTPVDRKEYYAGFANRVLWPTMHYRVGLTQFSRVDYEGYRRVNRRFAAAIASMARPKDLIWVHDYHLIPVAAELRALGVTNRIGYFHHIPWPPIEVLGVLPGVGALIEAMTAYDLVGVQTGVDEGNFIRTLMQAGRVARVGRASFSVGGRTCRVKAFPIGVDPAAVERDAASLAGRRMSSAMRRSVGGRKLVVGVDRLDYSKGIAPRIEAFGEFLALHPEWRRKVTYVQIATPSRMDVREYRDVGHRVDEAVSRVNSHLGEPDWAPIRLVKKAYPYAAICGLYRVADAALVTPMRDGMNLVAKEFVAAQTEEDPGALILSRFAGAAFRMREALIVNPFDSLDMVEALRAALDMPVEERRRRWKALRADIELRDIHWWTQAYLRALTRAR
jgi:trehalose 6-phosphate synthase